MSYNNNNNNNDIWENEEENWEEARLGLAKEFQTTEDKISINISRLDALDLSLNSLNLADISLSTTILELSSNFFLLNNNVVYLSQVISTISGIEAVFDYIDISNRINIIAQDLTSLSNKLDISISDLVSYNLIQDASINALKTIVSTYDASINAIETKNLEIIEDIDNLTNENAENKSNIDDLIIKNVGFETSIDDLQENISRFDTSINNLQIKISGFETSIDNLQEKDSQLEKIISDLLEKDGIHDTSINTLINKDSQIDSSLSSLILKDSQIDASLSQLYQLISDISISEISEISDNIIDNSINNISQQVLTLTTQYNTFEDYFTNKPYKLIDGSYISPDINNNYTIKLLWKIPEPKAKKAALNFIGSNHNIEGTKINMSLINSITKSALINDNIDLTNYNLLPYFDSLNIDYRIKTNPNEWITINSENLNINNNNSGPELYPQTEIAIFKLGTSTLTGTYDYNSSDKTLTYINENLFLLNNNEYQFRVYLKNQNDTPYPNNYIDSFDISGPVWNYLYIPDNSNTWISLPKRGAATSPQFIELQLQSGSQAYRTLYIQGANNNSAAEDGLNTPFNELTANNLYVNYGFDLLASRSSTSKQAITINPSYSNINQSYISNNLTSNTWNINNYTISNINKNPMRNANDNEIIFPGYKYDISGYFMKINTDNSENVYTENYPNIIPYPSIIIPHPSRDNVTSNYDNFVSSNNSLFSFSNNSTGNSYIVNTVYRRGSNNQSPISNVHFLSTTDSFNISSNNTYKLKNCRDINDNMYGTDLNNLDLCYFKFSTNSSGISDLNGAIRKGFIGNDTFEQLSNDYFEFSQSETKDAAKLIGDGNTAEDYRRQGWYLGVDINNLKIKNINLTNYPDIRTNGYSGWSINFEQLSADDILLGQNSYNLLIAEKPDTDINLTNYTITHDLTSDSSSFINFFGTKHINKDIKVTITGTFTGLNEYWRKDTNITASPLTLNLESTVLMPKNISWPTDNSTSLSFTEELNIIKNNIFYNNYKYSRSFSNQFNITGSYNNNIKRSTTSFSIPLNNILFGIDNRELLWDNTWNINTNTGIKNSLPNTNWINSGGSAIELLNCGQGLFPDFSEVNSAFDHSNEITDNQLMWCNSGYRSGGMDITNNNNPYINYTTKYNNNIDYSNYNNLGTYISIDDLKYSESTDITITDGLLNISNLSGTYKWFVFKAFKPTNSTRINVNIYNNNSNKLILAQDYLLYIIEDNNLIDSNILRTGWKSCQLIFNPALSIIKNNANGAGAYDTEYSNHPIKLYSNDINIPIYYRIGLKNNSNNNINYIEITYE